jgi:phage baseplate assembly protein W
MALTKPPIFSDFSTSFARNPAQNDVVRLTDFDAVKRSVRNLILTSKYERLIDPEIGANIYNLLFEPMDPTTTILITKAIEITLQNYEPRANIEQIIVTPDYDRNRYFIQVVFSLNTNQRQATVELFLNRIR